MPRLENGNVSRANQRSWRQRFQQALQRCKVRNDSCLTRQETMQRDLSDNSTCDSVRQISIKCIKLNTQNTLFLTPKQSSRQSHLSWSINVSERWEWILTFEVGLWTFFHQSLVGLQLFSNCPVHTASDWLGIASTSFGWSDVTQCM